jgi:hypothetical protein
MLVWKAKRPGPSSRLLEEIGGYMAVSEAPQRTSSESVLEAIVPKNPAQLLELAVEKGADVDQLGKLMDLQLRWQANEARLAWIEAMSRLKADMPTIFRTKHVDQGQGKANYWHAELDKSCPILIAALNKHGFTHRWETVENTKDWIAVSCVIQHKLGHSEKTTLGGPPDATGGKNAIQAIGSTKFYLERYTLFAALGIAPKGKDDDGAGGGLTNEWLAEQVGEIARCETPEGLMQAFKTASSTALDAKDINAYTVLKEAKDKRKKELK